MPAKGKWQESEVGKGDKIAERAMWSEKNSLQKMRTPLRNRGKKRIYQGEKKK